MSFDLAQTFFVDPALSANSATVGISQIDLWFRAAPKLGGNMSGILGPGVEVFIAPTVNGIPSVDRFGILPRTPPVFVRKEYGSIRLSQDAGLETSFKFDEPIVVRTGQEYAIVIKFDGNEDYIMWGSTQGEPLIGTGGTFVRDESGTAVFVPNDPSVGPSGQYVGKLFGYISPEDNQNNPAQPTSVQDALLNSVGNFSSQFPSTSTTTLPSPEYLLQNWKPWNDRDLKFKVFIARYAHGGLSVFSNTTLTDNPAINIHFDANNYFSEVSNGVFRIVAPSYPQEYLTYDRKTSTDIDTTKYGDVIYQDQVYWPGDVQVPATCNVATGNGFITGNSSYLVANGDAFNWTMVYNISKNPEFIVVVSEDHDGAGLHRVNVRQITDYAFNNTALMVSEAVTFTNNAAKFFKAPIARLQNRTRDYLFGKKHDILLLQDSNANDEVRFVNNVIQTITISAGGTGFANDDYVQIDGFENVTNELEGGYSAFANIVTDGSGIITTVYISNSGAGFVNTAAITYEIFNANTDVSVGTGETLTFTQGTTLKAELANAVFNGVEIVNLEAVNMKPDIDVDNPSGSVYTLINRTAYFGILTANTLSGKAYFHYDDPTVTDIEVKQKRLRTFTSENAPVLPSRSNQFSIRYANGFAPPANTVGDYFSNSSLYLIELSSNNDFTTAKFQPNRLFTKYRKYNINDDYTDEHTNYGNALAKAVQTKVNFAANQFAEDLIVYLTAHKPANTDIQVYARIHNSNDPESFGLKDWTRMEQIDGLGVFSNRTNPSDMKEYTYNFQAAPNVEFILTGSITTEISNAVIIGNGTDFVTDLTANDLIMIYQPLFPENYIVGVVNSITNTTFLDIVTPIANNGLVGDGIKMKKLAFPLQSFNNITNDNVARYYSTSRIEYDTFNSFQIKLVLLSDTDYVVPKIDDCRAVGVSS